MLAGIKSMKVVDAEVVTDEELGGGHLHTHESGVADHLAHNEEHAVQLARSIV